MAAPSVGIGGGAVSVSDAPPAVPRPRRCRLAGDRRVGHTRPGPHRHASPSTSPTQGAIRSRSTTSPRVTSGPVWCCPWLTLPPLTGSRRRCPSSPATRTPRTRRARARSPSPFFGSPGYELRGSTGPYDTGLIRLDNHTDSAVPVSSVTVDIGKKHYDPWASSSLSVPAQGTLCSAVPTARTSTPATRMALRAIRRCHRLQGQHVHLGRPHRVPAGPVGIAMTPSGDFFYTDYVTGQLYEVPAGG